MKFINLFLINIFIAQPVFAQNLPQIPNSNQYPNNTLGISKNYSAPPPSGIGQTVNIVQPMNLPAPPVLPAMPINKKVSKAFNDFEQSQLTHKQIKRLKNQNLKNSEASMSPYISMPKPVTRTLIIDLSPGVNAPILRLSSGSLTSIVFSGLNGDSWYIDSVKLNRGMFSDGASNGNEQPQTNVLTLEPLRPIAQGNVSVMLKGLSTPVIFSLVSGQKEVDFRVDVKIPGRNPDSTTKINYEERIPSIDDNVPYFLDGVPPKQAKRLRVTGGDVEAWELNNNMYIRTNADVQYPAYHSSARSTSGLAVYRFEQVYHSITLLQSGKAYTVMIENY